MNVEVFRKTRSAIVCLLDKGGVSQDHKDKKPQNNVFFFSSETVWNYSKHVLHLVCSASVNLQLLRQL